MTKQELEKWIERNEKTLNHNLLLLEECQKQIDFSKKIIEEIKKIKPDEN